ncbi:MAG: hypothetical protein ACXVCP_00285 [Bdellovibrio sp.]
MKNKFPLTEKLGLSLFRFQWNSEKNRYDYAVPAQDLEAALEKGIKVNGCYHDKENFDDRGWGFDQSKPRDITTHKGIVVCLEELHKEPLKHEYKTKIESCDGWLQMPQSFKGKNVKITVEEIRE